MTYKSAVELLTILREKNIIIYGLGFQALRFYEALKIYGLDKKVQCFITSYLEETVKRPCIDGIPVEWVDNMVFDYNIMICIAMHESIKEGAIFQLNHRGVENYIWIAPYLLELEIGEPPQKEIEVDLYKIWERNREDYSIAIRYLVIENYYKGNTIGYDLYKQFMQVAASEKTAEKRLQQFLSLIQSWEKQGYNKDAIISILDNYEIFDGKHRFTVALFWGQKSIMCQIFRQTERTFAFYSNMRNHKRILTREDVINIGFQTEIVKILDETILKMGAQYEN